MNKPTLLPHNATTQEGALEQTTARVEDVPVPLRTMWNPDTCPAALLPWLAWALSLDSWKSYWPEAVKRQRIKRAVEIQRRKGTADSVRKAVASFGGSLALKEWWQQDPPAAPHTFDILLTVGGDVPATAEYQQDIIDEVTRTKPVRSHFTLTAGVSAEGGMGLQGAIRGAVFKRITGGESPYFANLALYSSLRPTIYKRLIADEYIFDPADLFVNGAFGAVYDPSDVNTLFQDVDGIIPVTESGQLVALMLDKSGNGHHAVQANPEYMPVYQTDGQRHWLYVDGLAYMDTTLVMGLLSERSSIIGLEVEAGYAQFAYSDYYGNSADQGWCFVRIGSTDRFVASSRVTDIPSVGIGPTVVQQTAGHPEDGDFYMVNNAYGPLLVGSTQNNDTVRLFCRKGVSAYGIKGKFFGGIFLSNRSIGKNSYAARYIADKTGAPY